MIRYLFILIFLTSFSSCYTIHFTKSKRKPRSYLYSQWHHIALLGLLEVSPPVDLKNACEDEGDGDWSAARVQIGVVQGIIRTFPVIHANLYSPEEVSIACNK